MRQFYGYHRTGTAVFLALSILGERAAGQTKIDLAAQARNIDFSAAPFTRPLKTGATLPSTCRVGEMFFKTDAAAGSNLYGCTTQDVWTIQAGSNSISLSTGDLGDFAPSLVAGVLTLQPGRMRFGSAPCPAFTVPMTASIASGSGDGIAQLYISDSCAAVLEYPNTLGLSFSQNGIETLNGITAAAVATPSVPPGAFYLAEVLIHAGVITSFTDRRSVASAFSAVAGPGITVDCSVGPCLFSTDAATVPQLGGDNIFTGTEDARNAQQTFPSKHAASNPTSCVPGEQYFNTTISARLDCTATNTWTLPSAGVGGGGSGSGGSLFQKIDSQSSMVTAVNATDTTIVTSVVTSISTGKCIKWTWTGWTYSASLTLKIWYGDDSLTIAPGNFGSGPGAILSGYVCNNQGVQNAQTMTGSWAQNGWGGIALVNNTALVDSSTPQTLKLTVAGTGTVTTQIWTVEGVN